MISDIDATLLLSEDVGAGTRRLHFAVPWKDYIPGQFVMVGVPGGGTFLRRPFALSRLNEGRAELCVKMLGGGSRGLSNLPLGASVKLLGLLGHGFTVPPEMRTAVFVAGGYGIATFIGFAERLRERGKRVCLYYGGRTSSDLFLVNEFERIGVEVHIATEDGSLGIKGVATRDLSGHLASLEHPVLFGCGPEGLLRAVARLGIGHHIPTEVSMDTYMACGIGVCLGCVCEHHDGDYVRACREGPVFDVHRFHWGDE